MADLIERLEQNVAGKYYVDNTCTDCDLCRQIAPDIFQRNDDIGMSVVFHQPETDDEISMAEEAMDNCPTESIGNDGDE